MAFDIDSDFNYVILTCSKCNNSIKVMIDRPRGVHKVGDAITKLDKYAKKKKWQRKPDICPDHK